MSGADAEEPAALFADADVEDLHSPASGNGDLGGDPLQVVVMAVAHDDDGLLTFSEPPALLRQKAIGHLQRLGDARPAAGREVCECRSFDVLLPALNHG